MNLAQIKLKRGEDFFLELNTILATYAGHTIFSLFIEEPLVYKQILKQFNRAEFNQELSREGKLIENTTLRRFYRILHMPTASMPKTDSYNPDINCRICL